MTALHDFSSDELEYFERQYPEDVEYIFALFWGYIEESNWMCPELCPQMPPDSTKRLRTSADESGTKNPVLPGFSGLPWMLLFLNLVEAAGVEPASASTLPLALHA